MRIAEEWLNSCAGCEIAILNMGDGLVDLFSKIELVHMPLLMDHKYYGRCGKEKVLTLPEADVGLVSGSVRHEEHVAVLRQMRRQCRVLIALGTCATHGGIPALLNSWTNDEMQECVYNTVSTDPGVVPGRIVPSFLDRCYAVDEKVEIDFLLPGCPPNPGHIAETLTALMDGRSPVLPEKSVCDTCPTVRKGKGALKQVRRFLVNADYRPDEPLAEMRCLLEQGFICMGPVTIAGCARGEAPSCIAARVPCRGCYGPVKKNGNPLLDMMNALVSNGIDFHSVEDRKSLLRFVGAHGRLRVAKRKKQRS